MFVVLLQKKGFAFRESLQIYTELFGLLELNETSRNKTVSLKKTTERSREFDGRMDKPNRRVTRRRTRVRREVRFVRSFIAKKGFAFCESLQIYT